MKTRSLQVELNFKHGPDTVDTLQVAMMLPSEKAAMNDEAVLHIFDRACAQLRFRLVQQLENTR